MFSSLEEALNGFDLVIASSAKHRNVNEDYHLVGDLPTILSAKVDGVESVAVVFGREVSGLTNDELALCHILTTIPMLRSVLALALAVRSNCDNRLFTSSAVGGANRGATIMALSGLMSFAVGILPSSAASSAVVPRPLKGS